MENPEEILQCLEEFSKIKPKDIPRELEEYLCFVAKTGNPVYQWPVIKCLFRQKLINVIGDFYEACPAVDIPPCLNVDLFNYNTMKTFILEKLDTFVAAPFTVQRICELLTTPRKQYNRIDKYMRALEKNILVVSTTEPVYRSTENGDNNNQAIVNGLESDHLSSASSDDTPNINIEEMDDTPPPSWSPTTRNTTATITLNTQPPQTPGTQPDTADDEQTPPDRETVPETPSEPQDITPEPSAVPVVGGSGGFTRGVEEEGGGSSDDDDEEEERLLLGGDEEEGAKKPPPTIDNPPPTEETAPIIETSPAVEKAEITLSSETVVVEGGGGVIVVEGDAVVVSKLVQGDAANIGGKDSDNLSDKTDDVEQPQINTVEISTEITKKLPETENIQETIKSDATLPAEEKNLAEITDENVDVAVKSDIDNVKSPEISETTDKESEIAEKHETSAIVKEAEKLEKEVTEMENIPEVGKTDEKSEESEDIAENVANLGENENNVEQDERMEVDEDNLPDILEATSASL